MNVPEGLVYAQSHEWLKIDGEIATIGITDYAQSELGDIVYVDVPEAGRAVQTEESFGTIESVKTVSDIYAPVAGEIVETNPDLEGRSELVNSDPYGDGWIAKIRIAGSTDHLLKPDAYRSVLEAAS